MDLTTEQLSSLMTQTDPETYWNYMTMNAGSVWETGNYGQDSLTVVIDTGVYANHPMLGYSPDGPVIGGVDLSPDVGTGYEGYNLSTNHWHGTHVAGILAGSLGLVVNKKIHSLSVVYVP